MRGDQRGPTKAVCGPGGLNCNCCIRYIRSEAKVVDRRIRRRRAKQDLKVETLKVETSKAEVAE